MLNFHTRTIEQNELAVRGGRSKYSRRENTLRHVREHHCLQAIIATGLYLENIVKPRIGGENGGLSEVQNDRVTGWSYGSIIDKSIGVGVGLRTNRFFFND